MEREGGKGVERGHWQKRQGKLFNNYDTMELIDKITKKMAKAYAETWDKLMEQCFPNGEIDYTRVAVVHNPDYQEIKLDGLTIGTLYWKMRGNTISWVFNPVKDGKLTVEFHTL